MNGRLEINDMSERNTSRRETRRVTDCRRRAHPQKARRVWRFAPIFGWLLLAGSALAGLLAVSAPARAGNDEPFASQAIHLNQIAAHSPAALARYDRILIDPVSVAFSKDWRPNDNQPDPARQVRDADRDRIAANLAGIVQKRFADDLSRKNGYPIVNQPGPTVLQVSAHIVDLYINAPDVMAAGGSRSYVRSAGSMTLILELRDALTGQLIVRAKDHQIDPDNVWLTIANSVTNSAAADRAVDGWGRQLRTQLDSAHRTRASAPSN
jgi:hypothetical protein